MKLERSAGVVVYTYDKTTHAIEYLVLHYVPGHWDFPKGKIEAGETLQQAALRETTEETGLTVELDDGFEQMITYYFKDRSGELVHKEVTFFVGQAHSKEIKLSREHVGYQWLDGESATRQLTFQNAKQMLRMADRFVHTKYKDAISSVARAE